MSDPRQLTPEQARILGDAVRAERRALEPDEWAEVGFRAALASRSSSPAPDTERVVELIDRLIAQACRTWPRGGLAPDEWTPILNDFSRLKGDLLAAVASSPVPAKNGEPCDCETPGDWHRVANDFQRAMFEERARADKRQRGVIDALTVLQDRSKGSPEANAAAIDILSGSLAAPVSVGDEDEPMDRCDCNIPYLEGAGQHSPGCSVFKTDGGGDRG